MKNFPFQNYSYALSKGKDLIHVSAATRDDEYYCPHCQALMIPHMGKIRRWHFTHKANIENCNYETYLHKIAKKKIREAFLNATNFFISYDVPTVCSNKDLCKIHRGDNCYCYSQITHDIKQFYDTCREEVSYKNFVADLLLTSSSYPNREPILIEIYVSHKSTNEKVSDGVRIIEIQICSEEDIDLIVSSLRIEGIQATKDCYSDDERQKNIFFNFKGQVQKSPSYFNQIIPNFIHYFWMYDSGYFKVGRCLCDDDPLKYIPSKAHYIISPESFSWNWAFLEFVKRGVDVKNCLICKYSAMTTMSICEERICTLYKKYGTPRHPPISTAKTCQYFRRVIDVNHNSMFISSSMKEASDAEFKHAIVVTVK